MVGRMPYTVQKRCGIIQVCYMVVKGEFLIGRERSETQSRFPEKGLNHSNFFIEIIGIYLAKLVLEGFRIFHLLVISMEKNYRALVKNAL